MLRKGQQKDKEIVRKKLRKLEDQTRQSDIQQPFHILFLTYFTTDRKWHVFSFEESLSNICCFG